MTPTVAVAPAEPGWAVAAVEAGGGRIVPVEEAEALVWVSPHGVDDLRAALDRSPGNRWVQLPWAGVERYAAAGVLDAARTWTCGKGVYAEPVAEHALALLLAGFRDLPQRVTATTWGPQSGRSLFDEPVVVLGGGGITEALLAMLAPFRCRVTVVRKRPAPLEGADDVVGPERLLDVLAGTSAVVVALALTPETQGIIDAKALAAMPDDAWLVNVGRGGHVVTDDLVAALDRGGIGGAALDVTDPEPLPDGHRLWGRSNCIISPHTANTFAMALPSLSARITENVRRFGAGEPLVGLVDPALGY